MKLSIVIPVYNEQRTIAEVIRQVLDVQLDGIQKEVIVVNDGSTDSSQEIIDRECLRNTELVSAHHSPINLGKGAAIRQGIEIATGDILLFQDADLELNPREYGLLIEPLLAGETSVVYGSRFHGQNKNIPLRTRLANRFLTALTNLLFGSELTDMETAYKVFRSETIKGLVLRAERFDIEPEITAKLLRAGYTITEVPVAYNPRTVEEGKRISWLDGIEAILMLLHCRFTSVQARSVAAVRDDTATRV